MKSFAKLMLRCVTNWGALNLFLLVPLFLGVINLLPTRYVVIASAPAGATITLVDADNPVTGCQWLPNSKGVTMRLYLPNGCDYESLAMTIKGEGVEIHDILLERFCLLRNRCHLKHGLLQSAGKSFVAWQIILAGVLLEFLAFLVSLIAARYTDWKLSKESVLDVTLLAALMVAFVVVVLPVQSYLANRSLFEFTLLQLILTLFKYFGIGYVFSIVSLLILKICFGSVILRVVFAFLTCAYLETGVLAIGLPEMTGNMSFFLNYGRIIVDLCVLGIVFVAIVCCFKIFHVRVFYGVSLLAVLIVASLFDLKVERKPDFSKLIVSEFSCPGDVLRSVSFSRNRNVLVFVLDSLSISETEAIINDEESNLLPLFPGFVRYVDNVGMWPLTNYSEAGMLTGKFLEDPHKSIDYFNSIFGKDSVLKDALDARAKIFFVPGGFPYGYTNSRRGTITNRVVETDPMHARMEGQQEWSLPEVVLFRLTPFIGKRAMYRMLSLQWRRLNQMNSEEAAYRVIANATKNEMCDEETFLFVHTDGTHIPICRNRYGQLIAGVDNTFHGGVEEGIFVLKKLGVLFSKLQESGVYDSSLIVVTADHGPHYESGTGEAGVLPNRARPFLWIKAPYARERCSCNKELVSHENLAHLLRVALTLDSKADIPGLMRRRTRLFMSDIGNMRRKWNVEADGKITYEENSF